MSLQSGPQWAVSHRGGRAGALNQRDQNLESAATETNRLVALEQQSLCRKQVVEAKRDCARPKKAAGSASLNLLQLVNIVRLFQEPLCRLQISGFEPFGEPVVDRLKERQRLRGTVPIA